MDNQAILMDDLSEATSTSKAAKKIMFTIKARMLNYMPLTKIKMLKASLYDRFVSIMGTVVTVSSIRPFVRRLAFECASCKTTFVRV